MRGVKNLWTLSVQILKKGSVDWHFEQAVFCGRFGCLQPYSPFLVFALMVSAPPALNLTFFEWFQASFPHS